MFPFFYRISSLKTCVPFFLVSVSSTQCRTLKPSSSAQPIEITHWATSLCVQGEPISKWSAKRRQDFQINIYLFLNLGWMELSSVVLNVVLFTVYHTSKNFNLAPAATKGSCHIFRKSPYRGKNNNLDSLVYLKSLLFSLLPFTIHMDLNRHLKRALSSSSSPSVKRYST